MSGKSRCGGRRWGKDKKLHVSSLILDPGGVYRYGYRECGVKVELRIRSRWGMLEFVRHLGDETGRVGTTFENGGTKEGGSGWRARGGKVVWNELDGCGRREGMFQYRRESREPEMHEDAKDIYAPVLISLSRLWHHRLSSSHRRRNSRREHRLFPRHDRPRRNRRIVRNDPVLLSRLSVNHHFRHLLCSINPHPVLILPLLIRHARGTFLQSLRDLMRSIRRGKANELGHGGRESFRGDDHLGGCAKVRRWGLYGRRSRSGYEPYGKAGRGGIG